MSAVTFAFGDAGADIYGLVRDGRALLFERGEPRVVEGDAVGDRVRGARLDVRFEAVGPPMALPGIGSEQLCRVRGTVGERPVDCLGQRGEASDEPDWSRTEAVRNIAVWLGEDLAIALGALRPRGAHHHAEEAVAAAILQPDGAAGVADPRLSTTCDGDGRPLRAGLELWVRPDDPVPQRAAGEALYATALTLDGLRHECAFFRWHMDGREGVGRYGVVRPA